MVHAENHDAIAWLSEKMLAAGHTAPRFHGMAHAPIAEREATSRAISLAELVDVPILIVHVSAREAMEQIRLAKARGLKVYGETCPQYLFLTAEDLDRRASKEQIHVQSPAPRQGKPGTDLAGVRNRRVRRVLVRSRRLPLRRPGRKDEHGPNAPFKKVANGVPGLEVRTALLFSEGVGKGRIDLPKFVALTATNAAKLYGLYPRKGTIAVGSDADLAIWDPEKEVTIRQSKFTMRWTIRPTKG